jgi:hypothetical protein
MQSGPLENASVAYNRPFNSVNELADVKPLQIVTKIESRRRFLCDAFVGCKISDPAAGNEDLSVNIHSCCSLQLRRLIFAI